MKKKEQQNRYFFFKSNTIHFHYYKFLIILYTGQIKYLYSNISETATNTKYNKNIVRPKPLFIRHRKQAIDSTTNTSIINNIAMEHTMPLEFTCTG